MIKKKNCLTNRPFSLIFLFLSQVEARVQDQVFYWPIKPFIFMKDNNTIDGILPLLYNRLTELCSPNKNLARYILVNETFNQNKYYKSIEKAFFDMQGSPNISNAIWFPLFIWPDNMYLTPYNVKSHLFTFSPNIGVIANKNKITITNKIVESIKKSSSIALHAVGFILIFAALVWLAENKTNENFNKIYLKGFGTGLWWAIVTLSTVG
nr:uncharacterized protein LOC124809602 [Hydra vulgaris]